MPHPLEALSRRGRRAAFGWLLALIVALMTAMTVTGRPMQTAAAPRGVLHFELAGDPAAMQRILDSWAAPARESAAFNLGIDYLFLLAYSTAIALACLMAAGAMRIAGWPVAAAVGVPLAWGQWLAALLDAVENAALLRVLLAGPDGPWPALARWCALPKFGLVLAGLAYAAAGGAVWLLRQRRPSHRNTA